MDKVLNFGGASSRSPLSLFVVGSVNSSQPHYASIRNKTQVDSYAFTTPSSGQTSIRVTLCYTDYPAASGSNSAMVFKLMTAVSAYSCSLSDNSLQVNLLSVVLYHPATRTKYSPYLPGGLVPSNLQVIDLPANLAVPNSLYFVNVSVANNKLLYGPQVRISPFCLLAITNFVLPAAVCSSGDGSDDLSSALLPIQRIR